MTKHSFQIQDTVLVVAVSFTALPQSVFTEETEIQVTPIMPYTVVDLQKTLKGLKTSLSIVNMLLTWQIAHIAVTNTTAATLYRLIDCLEQAHLQDQDDADLKIRLAQIEIKLNRLVPNISPMKITKTEEK